MWRRSEFLRPQASTILAEQIQRGWDLAEAVAGMSFSEDLYTEWDTTRRRWADATTAALRQIFEGDAEAAAFGSTAYPITFYDADPWQDRLAADSRSVREAVKTLEQLSDALTRADGPGQVETTRIETSHNLDQDGPIFVVHGHAVATLHETVRVLERGTGREVIVLHEQPNAGRTILEKFEHHATGASYAVVLLTGDDQGGIASVSEQRLRGRQNVIFELGFFFGRLGRDRVAVLLDPDVEKPSDIDGLVYIELDAAGAWKYSLARELAHVGIEVDHARIP